ncbi:MAG: hypothetical protein ACQETL_18700 [Bacteroidota bacterium]
MERISRILFLVIISNLWTYQVLGCSCVSEILETEIKETAIIFTGRAVSVESFKISSSRYEQKYHRTTFEVLESIKGEGNDRLTVITDPYGSSCGYSFDKDSLYIVFGSYDYNGNLLGKKEITTGLCTRTGPLSRSAGLIRKLKKLGSQISSIESIDEYKLYREIWHGEKFIWTDEYSELLLSEAEQLKLLRTNLTYCETDSIFPQDEMDSIMFDVTSWNYKPTRVTVTFDVDENGEISNFGVFPFGNTDKQCQKMAIQFVKELKPWKPATIKGIKVKSDGFYEVDFAKCKSR